MNWRCSRGDHPRWSEALRRLWDPWELRLFALVERWLQGDQLAAHSCSTGSYSDDRPKLLSDTAEGIMVGNVHPIMPLGKFKLGMSKNFFTRRAVQQWSRYPGSHHPWRFWSWGTSGVASVIVVLWKRGWIRDLLRTWDLILRLLKPVVRSYQPKDWRLFQLHLLAQLDFLLLLWLMCKMTLKWFYFGWAEWCDCFKLYESWEQSLRLGEWGILKSQWFLE